MHPNLGLLYLQPLVLAAALGSAFALYPAASLRAEEATSNAAVTQPAHAATSAPTPVKPTPVAPVSSAAPRVITVPPEQLAHASTG